MLCNIGIMKITESFHMRYMNQSTLKKEVKKKDKKTSFFNMLGKHMYTMKITKSFHMRYTYQSTLKKEVVSYASF